MVALKDTDNAQQRDVSTKMKKKKTRVSPRKVTTAYAMCKDRKRILVEQVEDMQKELDTLKLWMLVKQGQVEKASKRTKVENKALHELIHNQHIALAATQASHNVHLQRSLGTLQPVQSVIYLGKNRADRHSSLQALKEAKLLQAERYLKYHSVEQSAKTIFNAIITLGFNADNVLCDVGTATIREDNELESDELAHLHLASLTSSGAIIFESNTVMFSKFVDGDDSKLDSYGVMVEDFVDLDELHPYQTGERVRRDTTTMLRVRLLPHHAGNLPKNPVKEMQESSVCWGNAGANDVRQLLANGALLDSSS